MSFSVAGKTAIVTGAAKGCGLAIGRRLLEEGANVMFADLDGETLTRELDDADDERGSYRIFVGDMREKLTVANLLSATIDAFDRVDILVNAARQIEVSDPLDAKSDNVLVMLNQNLMPALRMSQAVAKRMIEQGKDQDEGALGSIINLSSIAARRTHAELLGYSVATAALDQLTRSLAVALAPERIRVNSVAFGSVMSASLRSSLREDDAARRDIVDATPLHRIAGPSAVSDAVQYLASDASGFMTGQILTVDGGRTLVDPAGTAAH